MGLKRSTHAGHSEGVEPRAACDVQQLSARLADADVAVRREAARALAGEVDAVAGLCARLNVEPEASVRAALFTSLSQLGALPPASDAVVSGTLPLLRSEDAVLRCGAIELLAGMPDTVAPHMRTLLVDADVDVRIFSVNLLGNLPHVQVPQWLEQVLRADTAVNVVAAALEVIAEVGGRESVEAVKAAQARFDGEPFIAFAAQLALERIEST